MKCAQKTIRAEELEWQVLVYLERIHVPQKLLDFVLEELEKDRKNEGK